MPEDRCKYKKPCVDGYKGLKEEEKRQRRDILCMNSMKGKVAPSKFKVAGKTLFNATTVIGEREQNSAGFKFTGKGG